MRAQQPVSTTPPASGQSQPLAATLDLIGIAAIVWLTVLNLLRFDWQWDSLAYHLPFAALRAGLLTQGTYPLRYDLLQRFVGFPPLADCIQGMLWRVTGRPEAATLLAPMALALFSAYARWTITLPVFWSVAVVLAIPTTHLALGSANVDLWTNLIFCIFLLASWMLLTRPGERWRTHTAIAALSLGAAVSSKPQFEAIGLVALVILLASELVLLPHASGSVRSDRTRPILALLILFPVMFAWPLRNTIRFGNPVYPIVVSLAGVTLPGAEPPNYVGPLDLAHVPQPVRYVLSQLELDAIDARPHGFTLDQGYVPNGSPGDRMGGSLSVLALGSVAALVLAWRRRQPALQGKAAILAALTMVAAVAAFPQSHELRYFSFVNVAAGVAALAWLRWNRTSGDLYSAGLLAGFATLVVGSVMFVSFATGLQTLTLRGTQTLGEIIEKQGFNKDLAAARQTSSTICYTRPDPNALFLTPQLNPSPYARGDTVVAARWPADCPAGSGLIR